jgi:hypothetical protein
VRVNVGVGEARLDGRRGVRQESSFLGNRLRWQGDGKAEVRVQLGVGEARVSLR